MTIHLKYFRNPPRRFIGQAPSEGFHFFLKSGFDFSGQRLRPHGVERGSLKFLT